MKRTNWTYFVVTVIVLSASISAAGAFNASPNESHREGAPQASRNDDDDR